MLQPPCPQNAKATAASLSQADAILLALSRGDRLTPRDALFRFGCMRLGARIFDLKARGHSIESRFVEVTNTKGETVRVKQYFIEKTPKKVAR
ncbi:MAG: helix-turn-helix domain-containing protein [Desulfovibrionaceae bacterium]